ncbi:hypothetical protein [Vacuolonema iberomarrocanum]|uniref:hypothetical protein n=1 Tax=Vacuolonema iberomarrocanum TaxID=3454632 RepID=UPI0019FAA487|nr:hypothetical protein [filamentous cyanobacterium LEGE 07170]
MMKRPGYNPTRRNRNIGTEDASLSKDNKLVIPWAWADDRIFYERLVNPVIVDIQVRSVSLHIIVEPTLNGFAHACTVDDIQRLLELLPVRHITNITAFVLRQPKRKEQILAPVWGRLVYSSDICGFSGPTIYLEAQNADRPLKWSKSLSPGLARELERLRGDGHVVETDKRQHIITSTLLTIRNTQLFRTLPHEIGHYVDYLVNVEEPSNHNPDQWSELNDQYHSRPSQEKESFAHRYADEFRQQHTANGSIPFERIFDAVKMRDCGLNPRWFDPQSGA